MHTFKVSFENGVAVSAEMVDKALYPDIISWRHDGTIEWFIINCDSEQIAIQTAGKVVAEIWSKYI